MTAQAKLSDRAIAICDEHLRAPRSCAGCPILKACHAHCGSGQRALSSYYVSVNTLAQYSDVPE